MQVPPIIPSIISISFAYVYVALTDAVSVWVLVTLVRPPSHALYPDVLSVLNLASTWAYCSSVVKDARSPLFCWHLVLACCQVWPTAAQVQMTHHYYNPGKFTFLLLGNNNSVT